ncbi:hypothetical protein CK231_21995 [Mesorhizobium loti]|nr:hypothetical protein CK231_21995 [Mesorhizobium loti]
MTALPHGATVLLASKGRLLVRNAISTSSWVVRDVTQPDGLYLDAIWPDRQLNTASGFLKSLTA